MAGGWLKRLFPTPPLPSEYIGRFLSGDIAHDDFTSNIGDGWIGSNLECADWLNRVYAIERRFNPDFPSLSLDAFKQEAALQQLRQLHADLLANGQ